MPRDALDLLARRLHEMKSADARVELLIDPRCGVENFLVAGMRAADLSDCQVRPYRRTR